MTTTRRPLKPGKRPITKGAIEVCRRMLALQKPGNNNVQSEEFFAACRELDRLIPRQPWQSNLSDAVDGDDGGDLEARGIALELKAAAK